MPTRLYDHSDSLKQMYESLLENATEFAAAFMAKNNLNPNQIVMVVHQEADLNGFTQKIWFEKKKETEDGSGTAE